MKEWNVSIENRSAKNTAATDLPADVAQQNSVARIVVMPTNEELAMPAGLMKFLPKLIVVIE